MTADLLVIVPTRGRPQNAQAFYDAWSANTANADLLFVVDEDDPLLSTYKYRMQWMGGPGVRLAVCPAGLRLVGALNWAAVRSAPDYRYLGFMGDDHRCRSSKWDVALTNCLGPVGISYGNDLLQGEAMPTAVIMTANIVEALGYMAPPAMQHLCVDLVWKDWADALNCRVYLESVIIEHMHPANGKAITDTGYQLANSPTQVKRDADAYYTYKDGDFFDDVKKLQALLRGPSKCTDK